MRNCLVRFAPSSICLCIAAAKMARCSWFANLMLRFVRQQIVQCTQNQGHGSQRSALGVRHCATREESMKLERRASQMKQTDAVKIGDLQGTIRRRAYEIHAWSGRWQRPK